MHGAGGRGTGNDTDVYSSVNQKWRFTSAEVKRFFFQDSMSDRIFRQLAARPKKDNWRMK